MRGFLKRFIIFLLLCVFFPLRAYAGWNLVFDDEFNGPVLDHDKWFTRYMEHGDTGDHLKDEKQVYRENDNHIFKDGHLELTARRVGEGRYESGMIRTKQAFYYGYYEARVKFPSGRGVWPAFWMCCDLDALGKGHWPPEIDVFEFVNNGKDDTVNKVHIAVGNDADSPPTYKNEHYNRNGYTTDVDMTKDWHVWGLMWLPDRAAVYLDGVKLFSKPYFWTTKDGQAAGPAAVVFNLAIGGQWAGRYGIDDSAFPQALSIDYFRVYQYVPSGAEGVTSLPNVPDFSSYSYDAPGALDTPKVYPAQLPKTVHAGNMLNVIYHFDNAPTAQPMMLRLGLYNVRGALVYQRLLDLPLDTRQGRSSVKAQASFTVPEALPGGDYEVRMALAFCPFLTCKTSEFVNIPLNTGVGTVREAAAWYRVGRVHILAD